MRFYDYHFDTQIYHISGPLFTKRTGVSPQYHMKSRSREIWVSTFPIALKFDRHLGNVIGRGPEATAKLFTQESEVDILENLTGRTLRLISQK